MKLRLAILCCVLTAAGTALLLQHKPFAGPESALEEKLVPAGWGNSADPKRIGHPNETSVPLAELTQGVEETADVSRTDEALTLKLAGKLESLNSEQLRAVFKAVTRQLNLLTEEELKMRSSDNPEKRRAMLLIPALVGLLQKRDPLTVLAWTMDPRQSPQWKRKSGRMAAETLGIYARDQPAAATNWMREHAAMLSAADRERAWNSTLAGVAYSDPGMAIREAGNLGLPGGALELMVPALTSPEARKEWISAVSQVGDASVRARNWSGLVWDQVQTHGWEKAVAVLQADLPPEALTSGNLHLISTEALTRDPTKFAGILTNLPEAAASAAIPDFVSQWTERDYNAAATWLRGAPEQASWRDAAVESMVEKINSVDPDAAQVWAATITDPVLRARVMSK